MGVEGSVVALEVFLAAEATRAEGANESLGGVFSQRLLTSTTADRLGVGGGASFVVIVGRCNGVLRCSLSRLLVAVVVFVGGLFLDVTGVFRVRLFTAAGPFQGSLGGQHHVVVFEMHVAVVWRQETGGDKFFFKIRKAVGNLAILLAECDEIGSLALVA